MLTWTLFLFYVAVTFYLAYLGQKKTDSLKSYAIGRGNMSPWVVGMALAASMTSTATFIINPGIIYFYGLSALLGFGVAAALGLCLGIVILSKGFRKVGVETRALTVPSWIGARYDDEWMSFFFALVSLFMIAMVVLICYSMAILLMITLGLNQYELIGNYAFEAALAVTILFVFSYVMFGGTYAHAYTNTAQGLIMVVVASVLIYSGFHLFGDNFWGRLEAQDPNLVQPIHPYSLLFRNWFEVFLANFMVGFALSCQPHFLIKSLYVESEKDLNRYLIITVVVGILFTMVMLCGLYARVGSSAEVGKYLVTHKTGVDGVMPAYINHTFTPTTAAIISIALLAAGMSTLDGILVAISAIFANDIFLFFKRSGTEEEKMQLAFSVSKYSLVGLGIIAFGLSYYQHYYKEFSVLIFALEGVNALFAASFVPVLFGMFFKRLSKLAVMTASVSALFVHFFYRYSGYTILTTNDGSNPSLTAAYGLLVSLSIMAVYMIARKSELKTGDGEGGSGSGSGD